MEINVISNCILNYNIDYHRRKINVLNLIHIHIDFEEKRTMEFELFSQKDVLKNFFGGKEIDQFFVDTMFVEPSKEF